MKLREWWHKVFGPSATEILDKAIARAANARADAVEYEVRWRYYTTLVKHTDPHVEWWRFAELKQNQVDAEREFNLALEASVRCTSQLEALMEEARKV